MNIRLHHSNFRHIFLQPEERDEILIQLAQTSPQWLQQYWKDEKSIWVGALYNFRNTDDFHLFWSLAPEEVKTEYLQSMSEQSLVTGEWKTKENVRTLLKNIQTENLNKVIAKLFRYASDAGIGRLKISVGAVNEFTGNVRPHLVNAPETVAYLLLNPSVVAVFDFKLKNRTEVRKIFDLNHTILRNMTMDQIKSIMTGPQWYFVLNRIRKKISYSFVVPTGMIDWIKKDSFTDKLRRARTKNPKLDFTNIVEVGDSSHQE